MVNIYSQNIRKLSDMFCVKIRSNRLITLSDGAILFPSIKLADGSIRRVAVLYYSNGTIHYYTYNTHAEYESLRECVGKVINPIKGTKITKVIL